MEVWARSLADGSKAVALFNRHPGPMDMHVDFRQLGFNAPPHIRNIWDAKDLPAASEFSATVPGHGVVLLRVSK
jgi:alpha-galactosidase